jgi:hypothetical protein
MRPYIQEGVLESFYLWDPVALGTLTVHMAKTLVDGTAVVYGMTIPSYGKISLSTSDPKAVIMGAPIRFTRENIDSFDFGL